MKKRFLAVLLTLVMALALAVPGFAATETQLNLATYVNPWAFSNHLVKVNHNGMFGYVNYYGTIRVHEKYSTLNAFSEDLALASKDGAVCYVNNIGQEVITLGVCEAHDFHQGRARIVDNKDGHNNTYFIDKTGKNVIMLGNTTATDFNSFGLSKISRNGLFGLIDVNGNNMAHIAFDLIRNYTADGLAYAEYTLNGVKHKCYLNTQGKIVIDGLNTAYQYGDFYDGMAKVYDPATSQVGYIDNTGWLAVYCQYEAGDDFYDGVARIKRAGKWGYIDKANKYTVQPEYDYLGCNAPVAPPYNHVNGYIDPCNQVHSGTGEDSTIVVAGKWATETADGKTVFVINADNHVVAETTPGVSRTFMVYGYVNVKTGAEVVKLQYHSAEPFSDGLARVTLWGNTSFVNLAGVRVIDLGKTYDKVGDFSDNLCWVIKNGKYGYINKTGALQLPMIFDVLAGTDPADFVKGVAPARIASFSAASRWGVVSNACTWIVNPKYTAIDQFNAPDMIMLAQYGGVCSHILALNG